MKQSTVLVIMLLLIAVGLSFISSLEVECSTFNPCSGIEWSPSGNSQELIRSICVAGVCEPETKLVGCTSNDDCIDNPEGRTCDTKIWRCVSLPGPRSVTREIPIEDSRDNSSLFLAIGIILIVLLVLILLVVFFKLKKKGA